jgi:hypothetical protein
VVALRYGMDPIKFLSLEGLEKTVTEVILNKAEEKRVEDAERFMNNIAVSVQIGVAKAHSG